MVVELCNTNNKQNYKNRPELVGKRLFSHDDLDSYCARYKTLGTHFYLMREYFKAARFCYLC
jgi:hypothetical protein